MKTRIQILSEIDDLEDNNCRNCKMKGRTNRTNYCSAKCDIGIKMAELGKQLQSIKKERKPKMTKSVLDYDHYKVLKIQGKSNKEIAQEYGISEGTVYYKVNKWKADNGEVESKQEYEEVKQEVKKAAAVDENVVKALNIKIEELEKQVEDYRREKNRADELALINAKLQLEHDKALEYHKELFSKLDKAGIEINELKAVAEDTEAEASEAAKKEEKLLLELGELRGKVQAFSSENKKLDNDNQIIRKAAEEQFALNNLFRSVLKAVL